MLTGPPDHTLAELYPGPLESLPGGNSQCPAARVWITEKARRWGGGGRLNKELNKHASGKGRDLLRSLPTHVEDADFSGTRLGRQ